MGCSGGRNTFDILAQYLRALFRPIFLKLFLEKRFNMKIQYGRRIDKKVYSVLDCSTVQSIARFSGSRVNQKADPRKFLSLQIFARSRVNGV